MDTKEMSIYLYIQTNLKGFAISLTKNIHDAEDLIQDTCLRMFLSYGDRELSEQIKLSGRVMKNLFIDLFRKHQLLEELPEVQAKDELFESIQRKELQQALFEMKSKNQSFAWRLRLDGYSYNEISEITGKNNNDTGRFILLGKKTLTKKLKQ